MKKHLLIIPLLLISIAVIAFQKQIRRWLITDKVVNKEISFSIKIDSIYKSHAYDEAWAQLHILITKIKGDKKTIVWKKDFANMHLNQYECNKNAFSKKLNILIIDSKEKLEVNYVVTYYSKGKVLQLSDEKQIDKRAEQKFEIGI